MNNTHLKHAGACFLAIVLAVPARAQASAAGNAPQASGAAVSQDMKVIKHGTQASIKGPAQNFTGSVRVDPLFGADAPSRTTGAYVTFEPGARSAWHSHPLGQTLVVTAGVGRVQSWGGVVHELRPGDVVWTPPNVKHWHGASPTNAMTHMAISEQMEGAAVVWMERVTDAQYGAKP
jgi:quercetin dioxygenase-like cupin family protein